MPKFNSTDFVWFGFVIVVTLYLIIFLTVPSTEERRLAAPERVNRAVREMSVDTIGPCVVYTFDNHHRDEHFTVCRDSVNVAGWSH